MTSALSHRLHRARDRLRAMRHWLARETSRSESGHVVLSPRAQTAVLGAITAGVAFALLATTAVQALFAAPEEPPAAGQATDGVRLSASQLASLSVAPAQTVSFSGQQTTEGSIALDDDLATPVYSPYSGRVSRVIAAPGEQVAAGAPLMAVEAAEFVQAQDDLTAAVNALAAARAQNAVAESAAKRQRALYEAKGAALKDLEAAEAEAVAARGKLASAESDLAAVRNRLRILGKSNAEIAALEKRRDKDRSEREAVIAAPIAGTVMQRQVGPGQYIQANAPTPVYLIGDLRRVSLVANVRESELSTVRVGQEVEVTVPAYPGRVFRARITYVAPAIDPATRRLPVRAEIDNADGALKPQMFASFRILTDGERPVVAVPHDAVVYNADKAHVWVMRSDGLLVRREVTVGRRQGALIEAVAGLDDGERVVTNGPLFVDHAAENG
jgi:cobalt-zinc-cadmium efflux system membrane fusion protein